MECSYALGIFIINFAETCYVSGHVNESTNAWKFDTFLINSWVRCRFIEVTSAIVLCDMDVFHQH